MLSKSKKWYIVFLVSIIFCNLWSILALLYAHDMMLKKLEWIFGLGGLACILILLTVMLALLLHSLVRENADNENYAMSHVIALEKRMEEAKKRDEKMEKRMIEAEQRLKKLEQKQ